MSIGTWEPASGSQGESLNDAVIQSLQTIGQSVDDQVTASMLDSAGLSQSQWLMKLPAAEWQRAGSLENEALIGLIRFFTLVEGGVPGWDAGKDSPVIPLVRLLKERSAFEPTLRKWIKANTDNRYLPNGSAL